MLIRRSTILLAFGAFLSFARVGITQDLSPWTDPDKIYGNEWIDYSKKYVRVGVTVDGVYSVSLANLNAKANGANFTKNNVQIWHRGREVTPLRVTDTEVVFYGLKNDGASDGLMFRDNNNEVSPTSRLDKNASFYSHTGSYFFTTSANPLRSAVADVTPQSGTTKLTHHTATLTRHSDYIDNEQRRYHRSTSAPNFTKSVILGGNSLDGDPNSLNNSFFESNNALITAFTAPNSRYSIYHNTSVEASKSFRESFQLEDYMNGANQQIFMEYLLIGHSLLTRKISGSVAPTQADLNTTNTYILQSTSMSGYGTLKQSNVQLLPNVHFSNTGTGVIGFDIEELDSPALNMVGMSYYQIKYPQSLTLGTKDNRIFDLSSESIGKKNLTISNANSVSIVADITNASTPQILTGYTLQNNQLNFDVDKTTTRASKILVARSSAIVSVQSANINTVDFSPNRYFTSHTNPFVNQRINPAAFDYLMVTHDNQSAYVSNVQSPVVLSGAQEYASYRGSEAGGKFNVLLVTTRAIYDQFNYGEPSPIAIRRFVDYMISQGVRPRHNLVLVGGSLASYFTNIQIELPSEVPAWGEPGSDALLTAELKNSPYLHKDIPAIPVGRINAYSVQDVTNYLDKVKAYELATSTSDKGQLAWRRKVVSILGAKRANEISLFKGYFNQANSKMITSEGIPWDEKLISNESVAINAVSSDAPTTSANLHLDVNQGVGAVTYYGHGDQSTTICHIYDPVIQSSLYTPTNVGAKYPFLFVTGCGIGNIYTSRLTKTMATNWVVVPNKGAIVLMANSYKAYTSTAASFMEDMYESIFGIADVNRKPIGAAFVEAAVKQLSGGAGARVMAIEPRVIANIHQTIIVGDPVMTILGVTGSTALPVNFETVRVVKGENKSAHIYWTTGMEQDNDHFEIERSIDGKSFDLIGKVKSIAENGSAASYTFVDVSPAEGLNYYRIKQVDKDYISSSYSKIVVVEFEKNSEVIIYPNPFVERFSIKLEAPISVISWKIYNVSGKVISEGNSNEIEFKDESVGNYIIELNTTNGVIRKSILKQ